MVPEKSLHFCVLLIWSFATSLAQTETVCVSSNNTRNRTGAVLCTHWVTTLTDIRDDPVQSDTTVVFFNGTFILDFHWELFNVSSVSIKKEESSSTAIIMCNGEGILVLRNTSNMEISGLDIVNCSCTEEMLPVTVYNMTLTVMPALLILFGRDLRLKDIAIEDSSTGLCLVDVAGSVDVVTVRVSNQKKLSQESNVFTGNLILYTSSTNIETVLNISGLHISNCGHIKNYSPAKTEFIPPSGLTLQLNSTAVSVTIRDSVLSRNEGRLGGNLLLLLYYLKVNTTEPAVVVHNVTFEHGTAVYGGGLYISFERSFYQQPNSLKNDTNHAFRIINCTFKSNVAYYGGGGLYIQWDKSTYYYKTYNACIVECTFIRNALMNDGAGLALHFKLYINAPGENKKHAKFHVDVHIHRCNFTSHNRSGLSKSSENGVIFANSAKLMLDTVYITDNFVTAIFVVNCKITFSGSSVLSNNMAVNGGGLKLCSNSLIFFKNHTKLLLSNNTAETVGGGIMVSSKCLAEMPMCFYQFFTEKLEYPDKFVTINTIDITLRNNSAKLAGHNIYGGSIDHCYLFFIRNENKKLIKAFNVPPNTISNPTSVSSNPQHVCLTNGQNFSCIKERNISVFPGETVCLKVKVVGQCNGSVPGIVHASPKGLLILSERDINVTNSNGEFIKFKIATDSNKTSQGQLYLGVGTGSNFIIFTEYTRFRPVNITVHFKECPSGFILIHGSEHPGGYVCDCKVFNGVRKCHLEDKYASIIKEVNFWIGVVTKNGHSIFLSAKCPLDYCNRSFTNVSVATRTLQDAQCKHNRTGVLCGACLKGWSMMLGTSSCSQSCSNFTILLIIPFLLAGLFLLIVVSFLNLTVTAGTINGVIFYANVLQDYQVKLLVKHHVKYLSPILKVFLSWINLDLGIPLCFFKGMDAFSKVLLQAAFQLYLWLIAIVIIKLSNRYVSVTRLIGKNPVQVLATLFLLSYSKMLRVTLSTIKFTRLHVYDEASNTSDVEWRWFLDGQQIYFTSTYHLILSMVALLFVTLTLPFMISLLCTRHIFSMSNYCKCFSFINKLKPFFDAYSGPFKDNARFWPGLLLLVRLVLLLVNVVPNIYSYYIINIVVMFLLALMVYLNGVYKSRTLNIIEHSFLLNLAVIFASLAASRRPYPDWNRFVVHASISVAAVMVIGIVGYHVKLKLSNMKWVREATTQRLNISQTFDVLSAERRRLIERVESVSYDDSMSDVDKLVDFST